MRSVGPAQKGFVSTRQDHEAGNPHLEETVFLAFIVLAVRVERSPRSYVTLVAIGQGALDTGVELERPTDLPTTFGQYELF